ncbi:plasmolipin [Rana temporaria]|uniref:plasmolipin n=1 Tax=Rana temporaria TaxID=8407 RepID=UPI001AACD3DF|nr:plasmolipin [Rana temporaria]
MAEFPAKVSTQTSTADAAGHGIRFFLRPDMAFLKSIPAILMVVELVFGLLVWALVADSHYWAVPAYGWVMFVALFCWLVTLILFVLLIFQIHKRLSVIPWPMAIFIYHAAATVLYVTGFITCAASTKVNASTNDFNKRAAASFFACLVMIAYGASTFFSFTDWRGPGSNAASAQA